MPHSPPPSLQAPEVATTGFLRHFGRVSQTPADIAVVMPSIWRPELGQAIRSVIEQDFPGTIQLVIGFDLPAPAGVDLAGLIGDLPPHRAVIAFYPGYSTSARHGGVHLSYDGGALRSILSYMANAWRVAYLDDDNWWAPQHLRLLHAAIDGVQWSFAMRWFVDPRDDHSICVDDWESVGPGRGVWVQKFNGFVDPNCLMLDKLACESVLSLWTVPLREDPTRMSADRYVFGMLSQRFAWRAVEQPTVYYRINLSDPVFPDRNRVLSARGLGVVLDSTP